MLTDQQHLSQQEFRNCAQQVGILFQRFPNLFAKEIFGLSKSERDLEKNIHSTKQSNETQFHI